MGLSADAFYQVISQVGNYSDIFDRHLTPLGITREGSANAQWTDGGLIYARRPADPSADRSHLTPRRVPS